MKTNKRFFKLTGFMFVAAIASAGCVGGPPIDETSEATTFPNDHAAYNFFVGKGLTNFQAAGIVGNLDQESGDNPTAVQYGGGPGRGIAQWSVGGRWNGGGSDTVAHLASARGESMWSLNLQLEFIWYELTNFGYGYSALRNTTNVTAATIVFQNDYEICGTCDQTGRINYAKAVLAAYGNSGGGGGGGGSCGVHSDSKLYCDNTAGAPLHSIPTNGSAVVNHLRTTYSYFTCWGTGDLHAGGNHTWYFTVGDDNGNAGWTPAVELQTASSFDANPSAAGLPRCGGNGGTANCNVHTDGKLYCVDVAGAAMHASPTLGSAVVNHLRTTNSYFQCWGTGDRHAGGNTTWYYTIGDDNGNWGWVPAVDLQTNSSFDANPSAAGFPHC